MTQFSPRDPHGVRDLLLARLRALESGEGLSEESLPEGPAYVAPEVRTDGSVGVPQRLYTLGAAAFTELTGEIPTGLEGPCDVRPELDPRWDPLVSGLMAPAAQRLDLVGALRRARGVSAEAGPPVEERIRRRRVWVSASLLRRALAGFLDALPWIGLAVLIAQSTGWTPVRAGLVGALGLTLSEVGGLAIFATTPGRRVLGLWVRDGGGRALTWEAALQRTLWRWIASIGAWGYLPLAWGEPAHHDDLAKSRVVSNR